MFDNLFVFAAGYIVAVLFHSKDSFLNALIVNGYAKLQEVLAKKK